MLRVNVGDALRIRFTNLLRPADERPDDSTATRSASVHVTGLEIRNIEALGGNIGRGPDSLAEPGETRVYELFADKEGTFLFHSGGALAGGGEGDGGQTVLGLFGGSSPPPRCPRGTPTGRPGSTTTRWTSTASRSSGCNDRDEIVHGDLNAIIAGYEESQLDSPTPVAPGRFREFTVLFHDELKAVQAFEKLEVDETFHGVRDGFGVNYGASGFGSILLANRARLGPSKKCIECAYEEFFLSSWANGDPAMIVERDRRGNATEALFPDDPSNVHHAYLGDPVWFRNVRLPPPRAPVAEDAERREREHPGRAIPGRGLHLQRRQGRQPRPDAGRRDLPLPYRFLPDGEIKKGTPTPALVPVPEIAMPPMPTYKPTVVELPGGGREVRPPMPGYPFYIAALKGHRAPQPPLDLLVDGGLPRHVVTSVPPGGAEFGRRGTFDVEIEEANIKLLPNEGTPSELAAQAFHAGRFPGATPITTTDGFPAQAYPAFTPEGEPALFAVNGQPPAPGAPYANPCPPGAPERRYRSAFVQLDGVVNQRCASSSSRTTSTPPCRARGAAVHPRQLERLRRLGGDELAPQRAGSGSVPDLHAHRHTSTS
ncbi:hypothetical protein BE20_03875 [Sorangium cellulosum]|nr:hypothetical protein BE20_03875 [Sorangium cellulosum]